MLILFVASQIIAVLSLLVLLAYSLWLSSQPRTIYISSLSSGVSSAVATQRAIDRYGISNVIAVFMDTLWEDDDNYRFLAECEAHYGIKAHRIVEGRTPLQVGHDEHIIPNQKIAPCTKRLKILPFLEYVNQWDRAGYNVVIILGMDWKETHRMEAPRRNYGARGYSVEYPLMWKPYESNMFDTVRSWGIEPPRMYAMDYSHANCGGRCVKQGQKDWNRTYTYFPERFEEVATWEAIQRTDPVLADYAFVRKQRNGVVGNITLYDLQREWEAEEVPPMVKLWTQATKHAVQGKEDDTTFCFCNAGDPGPIDNND